MVPTSTGTETPPTTADLLEPLLSAAAGRAAAEALLLEEQLGSFAARRGLPVEDRGGRRVAVAPLHALGPESIWAFVADFLPTHLSLPVRRLGRMGRLLERALAEAGERGLLDPAGAESLATACRRATRTLPRLDRFARALRAHVTAGRPGVELFRRDPQGYAEAMRNWDASRPLAEEEREGGFVVQEVGEGRLVFVHPSVSSPLEVAVPREVAAQAREADRVDALLGRRRDQWFFVDSFAVAGGTPADLAAPSAPPAGTKPA